MLRDASSFSDQVPAWGVREPGSGEVSLAVRYKYLLRPSSRMGRAGAGIRRLGALLRDASALSDPTRGPRPAGTGIRRHEPCCEIQVPSQTLLAGRGLREQGSGDVSLAGRCKYLLRPSSRMGRAGTGIRRREPLLRDASALSDPTRGPRPVGIGIRRHEPCCEIQVPSKTLLAGRGLREPGSRDVSLAVRYKHLLRPYSQGEASGNRDEET